MSKLLQPSFYSDTSDHAFVDLIFNEGHFDKHIEQVMTTTRRGDVIHAKYFPNNPTASSERFDVIEKSYDATDVNSYMEFVADVHSIALAGLYSGLLEARKVEHCIADLAKEFKDKFIGFQNMLPEGFYLDFFSGDFVPTYSWRMLYKFLLDPIIVIDYERDLIPEYDFNLSRESTLSRPGTVVDEAMFHDIVKLMKPKTLTLRNELMRSIKPLKEWAEDNLESLIALSPDLVYEDEIDVNVMSGRSRHDRTTFLSIHIKTVDGEPVVSKYCLHYMQSVIQRMGDFQ